MNRLQHALTLSTLTLITMCSGNGDVKGASSSSSPTTSHTIEIFDNIIKSPRDERSYRGLKLANDLKVLLISDPTTKVSAASMTLGTGAVYDFQDIPGLASLVAYLLTKGSEKYPSDLKDFLKTHGGRTDNFPKTRAQEQVFRFEVESDFLGLALEKFAQFFLAPNKLDEITSTELYDAINEMQGEHENREQDKGLRIMLVEKSLFFKKKHQLRRLFFGKLRMEIRWPLKITLLNSASMFLGNRETLLTEPLWRDMKESGNCQSRDTELTRLKTVVHPKVLQFHALWYSSNIMCLALLGRESLDELQEMVTSLFEKVENRNAKKLAFPFKFHPIGPEQLKHEVHIILRLEKDILRVFFPTPDFSLQYKTSPSAYVSYLIEHQRGPTSLFFILSQLNYCTDIRTKYGILATGMAIYIIEFDVTESGLTFQKILLHLLFQYLHLLRTKGIQEWIFNELNKLDEMNFLFGDVQDAPLSFVQAISSSMQNYPMEDVLSYSYRRDRWDSSLIKEFLSYLNPRNMNYSVVSKRRHNFTQKEKWYQTPYAFRPISESYIKEWEKVSWSKAFKIPMRNKFIPQNFALYKLEENTPTDEPYVIHKSSTSRFWLKQHDEFKVPKLEVLFEIFCPSVRWDPFRRFFYQLFSSSLLYFMNNNEYSWYANKAGFKWDINSFPLDFRIEIRISGYSDKMEVILEEFISIFINSREFVTEDAFEKTRKGTLENWTRMHIFDQSYQLNWYRRLLLDESSWSENDIIRALRGAKHQHWLRFSRTIFSRVFVQGLIVGNCDENKARKIVNIIERPFKSSSGLLEQEILPIRTVEMNGDVQYVHTTFNTEPNTYTYAAYFLFNPESNFFDAFHVASLVFIMMIDKTSETIIPNKLGRTDRCAILSLKGNGGVYIQLSSKRHSIYMDTQTEKFLQTTRELLENMTDIELEEYKEKLKRVEFEKTLTLETLTDFYWAEISDRLYNFDRREAQIDHLRFLRKRDMLAFFQEVLDKSSGKRRKLTIHLLPKERSTDLQMSSATTRINDIVEFKSSCSLHAINTPYWYLLED